LMSASHALALVIVIVNGGTKMFRPLGSHGHYYSYEDYALIRACNAAVSAQILILEVLEMKTTPHGAAQKVRYHLAKLRLVNSLSWLKKAQRSTAKSRRGKPC